MAVCGELIKFTYITTIYILIFSLFFRAKYDVNIGELKMHNDVCITR